MNAGLDMQIAQVIATLALIDEAERPSSLADAWPLFERDVQYSLWLGDRDDQRLGSR